MFVGRLIQAAGTYPSGVPGVDLNGDQALSGDNSNTYIEVKNFLWRYSKIRDRKFRKLYPDINLVLLLKKDYLKLENKYSKFIKNWEYKNSPFLS